LGLVRGSLRFCTVSVQGGMIYRVGTVYYLRYTISTSLLLRYTTLMFRRAM